MANTREIDKKDNFFSIKMKTGETYTVAVDGEVVITTVMGDECTVNSYVKRDAIPMQYKD